MKITLRFITCRGYGCLLPAALFLSAILIVGAGGVGAQQGSTPSTFIGRYQARVTATQNAQPHWVTPLVTVTPRLEQELRTDFVHSYNKSGKGIWNYGNGKGLEFIPERHTEIIVNVPPFFNRSNGESDGFGDISFLAKERLFARNEEHGNGSCCAVVTPTLAVGKGFRQLALTSTAGGVLPVSNVKKLGRTIVWNSAIQYRVAKSGFARLLWPEVEFNSSFFEGGSNDGKTAAYVTPGIIVGRVALSHDAEGRPGRLGLTVGVGEQIALTHFKNYNHAAVITVRLPF